MASECQHQNGMQHVVQMEVFRLTLLRNLVNFAYATSENLSLVTGRKIMLAELQFVTVGSGEEQKELIAKTVDIIEKSELDYQLTAMGTLVEGDWEEIMTLVSKCQAVLLKESDRVISDISIDDRKGESNRLRGKVLEIEYALGRGLQTAGLT